MTCPVIILKLHWITHTLSRLNRPFFASHFETEQSLKFSRTIQPSLAGNFQRTGDRTRPQLGSEYSKFACLLRE